MIELQPFQSEEHQPFRWTGGQPAALLVHGFPGTPAELRPLAQSLHRSGWTVQAPLLPGFGPEIQTLSDRKSLEWVAAVRESLAELQRRHSPIMLLGYSMGAALAIQAAALQPPAGLALLAPFQRLGSRWHRLVGFLLRPFFRRVRPFRKANFSDPQLRQSISNFFGEVDLDDPDTQQFLRELSVSTRIFQELNRVGQAAYRLAPESGRPTLILQGLRDEVVSPAETRALLPRFSGPLYYREVAAAHNLLDSTQPGWPRIEGTILEFADMLIEGSV